MGSKQKKSVGICCFITAEQLNVLKPDGKEEGKKNKSNFLKF